MHDSIFREYDIRGKVGSELLIENVSQLGAAIAAFFYEQNPQVKTVLVGMDARTTSPDIKELICDALQESGLDVIFIGICPSPVLYFGLFTLNVNAGVMITASHNPPEYNGIKLALDQKFIWGDQIRYIGKLFAQGTKVSGKPRGLYTTHELIPHYISWMVDHFPSLNNQPINAVIDTGNGTGGTVVPELARAFGWKNVSLLCAQVLGTPEKHEADPVVEKNMADVREALVLPSDCAKAPSDRDAFTQACPPSLDTKMLRIFTRDERGEGLQVGIGLDGDCDRMAAMTKAGKLIFGDRLFAVFAEQFLKEHPQATLVFDIKASSGLIDLVKQLGGKLVLSPSGHAIIKHYMHENNALLGGELSCHFFFHDRYFGYDDGIYAMLRLFEIMVQTGKSLDQLVSIFPAKVSSPEIRLACPEEKKKAIIEQVKNYFQADPQAQLITIDGVRASLPFGWGLVRASNTQPVLSIRFEANTAADLRKIKEAFIKAFGSYYTTEQLADEFQLGA